MAQGRGGAETAPRPSLLLADLLHSDNRKDCCRPLQAPPLPHDRHRTGDLAAQRLAPRHPALALLLLGSLGRERCHKPRGRESGAPRCGKNLVATTATLAPVAANGLVQPGGEMAGNRLDEPLAGHAFSDHFGHTPALAYAVIWSW